MSRGRRALGLRVLPLVVLGLASQLLSSFAHPLYAAPEASTPSDAGVDLAQVGVSPVDLSRLLVNFDPHDSDARQRATSLVQKLGERATAPLIRAAHDPNRTVARWAAGELEALGRKIPGDAVQTKSNQVLSAVLEAYGDTHDADALGAVLSFVNSGRAEVRDAARKAIFAYGDAGLAKTREVYTNLMGHPPPGAWSASDVARELFAAYDRLRLEDEYALLSQGLAEETAGRHEAAVADFEKILARQPLFERRAEMAPAFVLAAQSKEDADPEGAAAYYRTAERISPDGPRATQAKSGLLYLEGEDLLARGIPDENVFRLAASEDPGNTKARAELARIESARANRERTLRRYGEAGLAAAAVFVGLAFIPRRRARTKR